MLSFQLNPPHKGGGEKKGRRHRNPCQGKRETLLADLGADASGENRKHNLLFQAVEKKKGVLVPVPRNSCEGSLSSLKRGEKREGEGGPFFVLVRAFLSKVAHAKRESQSLLTSFLCRRKGGKGRNVPSSSASSRRRRSNIFLASCRIEGLGSNSRSIPRKGKFLLFLSKGGDTFKREREKTPTWREGGGEEAPQV